MTPPKLDLAEICPELAKILAELEEFRQEYEKNPSTLSYRVTPGQFKAIAATMLKLAEENESILVDLYRDGADAQVARLCDEKLDRSGALLGRIRTLAARKGDATGE